ncbi:PD40 domain-containing protein [Kineosporia mesophila]|uniref:PD40 domain-containing protein n=1 Tax=Kineosporia mesophila TaxID=566012 RepID=A0ABP6Z9K0_9ACTN|nr:hypothetical protein [Kineosporia mesophila]MCD5352628.1 hypothetical protein [Kineosporia mesophila]
MQRRHGRLLALLAATTAAALPVTAGAARADTGPTFTRVSTDSAGGQLDSMNDAEDITPDGRYVLFTSYVSMPGTPSNSIRSNLFLKDTTTGTTRPVDVALGGGIPDGNGAGGKVSDNGRYVAFTSAATNLVAADTNGKTDVFRRDMRTGTITRVSIGTSGAADSGGGYVYSSISGDGNLIAFDSPATDLVPNDTNGTKDIFVRNLKTKVTSRVSVSSTGEQSEPEPANPPTIYTKNRDNGEPVISGDGRTVAFSSRAENLVPGDTNLTMDVFVHSLVDGTTTRVSVKNDGSQSTTGVRGSGSSSPSISANGKAVAFYSTYTDLVTPGAHANDVYVRHLDTGVTELVEITTDGGQGASGARSPVISPSGQSVAFDSQDTNVAPGDPGSGTFVRNLSTGNVYRLAENAAGEPFDLWVSITAIADDTTFLFQSAATNIVPGDTNENWDSFVVTY